MSFSDTMKVIYRRDKFSMAFCRPSRIYIMAIMYYGNRRFEMFNRLRNMYKFHYQVKYQH